MQHISAGSVGAEACADTHTLEMIGVDTAELACPHFALCPGCTVEKRHLSTPLALDCQRFFAQHSPGPVTLVLGPIQGWRTVAKLAVREVGGRCGIGLFRQGSHQLLEVPDCRVHHSAINAAVATLLPALAEAAIEPYHEARGRGALRYLLFQVERHTGLVQLSLVWNAKTLQEAEMSGLRRLTNLLEREMGQRWRSVWVNLNSSRTNNIVSVAGDSWHHLLGAPFTEELVGHVRFQFPPTVFRQANLDAFQRIIDAVVRVVPAGAAVCELYSGIGVIGLNVLLRCDAVWVRCSDDNPNLAAPFAAAVRLLPEPLQSRATFRCLPALEALRAGEAAGASVLLVDPPRKGLSAGELELLSHPSSLPALTRIVYVSCGFPALKRDTLALLAAGHWRVVSVEGHLLFPGTNHIETVVVFDRQGPPLDAATTAAAVAALTLAPAPRTPELPRQPAAAAPTPDNAKPTHRFKRRRSPKARH
eukprot:EG_transcript_7396